MKKGIKRTFKDDKGNKMTHTKTGRPRKYNRFRNRFNVKFSTLLNSSNRNRAGMISNGQGFLWHSHSAAWNPIIGLSIELEIFGSIGSEGAGREV